MKETLYCSRILYLCFCLSLTETNKFSTTHELLLFFAPTRDVAVYLTMKASDNSVT